MKIALLFSLLFFVFFNNLNPLKFHLHIFAFITFYLLLFFLMPQQLRDAKNKIIENLKSFFAIVVVVFITLVPDLIRLWLIIIVQGFEAFCLLKHRPKMMSC